MADDRKNRRLRIRGRVRIGQAIVVCALLAGCADGGRPSDQDLAQHGYWYHDPNHQGGASGHPSPQALYNATHGIWLWPPAEGDVPPD